jgi:UDP-N-acetylmuramoyl-tripeptide--D-alanyl-D-alanine ligase
MAVNAAAALACVGAVGADLELGAAALSDVGLSALRMHVARSASGVLVVNDSYNANPTSMRAAIDALLDLPAQRRVAILGVMAEISDAEAEHRAIARYAADRDVELIAVGTALYGVEPWPADQLEQWTATAEVAVLVKGSRVAGLETVAAALLAR